MISPQFPISGFLIKWMCCSIIFLEHNPTMSSLHHNSLGSHYTILVCPSMQTCLEHKHDMSRNSHGCSDISGLCSNDVCSETKFHSGRFRAQTCYVHYCNYFPKTTLCTVRLQLYKSCTMMFALVSIIYPRITMIGEYTEIRDHLQTFNVDYLGTSKMDIS